MPVHRVGAEGLSGREFTEVVPVEGVSALVASPLERPLPGHAYAQAGLPAAAVPLELLDQGPHVRGEERHILHICILSFIHCLAGHGLSMGLPRGGEAGIPCEIGNRALSSSPSAPRSWRPMTGSSLRSGHWISFQLRSFENSCDKRADGREGLIIEPPRPSPRGTRGVWRSRAKRRARIGARASGDVGCPGRALRHANDRLGSPAKGTTCCVWHRSPSRQDPSTDRFLALRYLS